MKTAVFADITNPRLLVIKGGLFVVLGLLASVLLAALLIAGDLTPRPHWSIPFGLHATAIWAWCRAYYFAFYVLEKYVDPSARYAGLGAAARHALRLLRRGG